MGKIRVEDLARMMGIPPQDLVFKLKSLGVRVEGDDAMIDSEIIQAILQGKRMPSPREVIIRDGEAKATTPARRPPHHRMPLNPLRPNRPRTMIQRVEPRIKTIPTRERPAAEKPAEATPVAEVEATQAAVAVEETPVPVTEVVETEPQVKAEAPVAVEEPEVAEVVSEPVVETKEDVSRKERRERRREGSAARATALVPFKAGKPGGPVTVTEGMTVREYAEKLGVKSKDLIKLLFSRGIMANINATLSPELAIEIAEDLGVEASEVSFEEEVQLRNEQTQEQVDDSEKAARAPVVTIMGHVDHGKTTLLDAIRSSRVTETEFGGITQHIAAYDVQVDDKKVVFLDTPGHEAFTRMRARGANATDLVILVVAADDGVMPQTIEAIDHARAAEVPIIVAINKIDKANANQDKVKKELADRGLMVEDWGGDIVSVPMSALKGEGIKELLEMILITADLLDLKASPERSAQGVVIEARKEQGRGVISTILVQDGTLRVGDIFVAGSSWGKCRSILSDTGARLDLAGPATPVEVTGFGDPPQAGDAFQVVAAEAKARGIAEYRKHERRQRELAPQAKKVSLEDLFGQLQQGEVKELKVVLKADVQGSVEVLKDTLAKLSTEKVTVQVILSGVGAISTNDVLLASASNGIVVGFNVRPERKATDLAAKEQVDIRLHTVIYELADELKKAMVGLLDPEFEQVEKGRAEVRETFKIPRSGVIAGCHVVEGVIPRSASVRLLRDNIVVYEGKISSLRRFKDDVAEVRTGFDCGIGLEKFQDVKPGDFIEAFDKEEITPSL